MSEETPQEIKPQEVRVPGEEPSPLPPPQEVPSSGVPPPQAPGYPACSPGPKPSRTKEKMKEYKVSLKKNWTIFKQSKLGLIGISIILIFVIMALGAPYFGLRDPIRWYAPESDIIAVKNNYNVDVSGSILCQPTVQYNGAKTSVLVEKVFIGTDKGILYAIYPFNMGSDRKVWQYQCDGAIISSPNIKYNTVDTSIDDDIVYVTSVNGYVYAIHADTNTPSSISPSKGGVLAWKFKTDAGIRGSVGVDSWFEDPSQRLAILNVNDVYVGSDNGTAYGLYDNGNNVTSKWQKHLTNAPLLTPIVDHGVDLSNTTDDLVYFTATNGKVFALNANDGQIKWIYTAGSKLDTIPVVDISKDLIPGIDAKQKEHRIIIANATGYLHFVNPDGNSVLTMPLYLPQNHPLYKASTPAGKLSTPYLMMSGEELYVGSESGVVYAIRKDSDSAPGVWNYSLKWNYTAPKDAITNLPIPIAQPPTFDKAHSTVFVVINGNKILSIDGKDVIRRAGTIIGLGSQGMLTWTYTVNKDGNVSAPAISLFTENNIGRVGITVMMPQLYVGDSSGVFSAYDSGGEIKTPLPPTWMPGTNKPPSGNSYLLGTDREGRDIFSQLITGSRVALAVGILSAFFSVMLGTIIGITAGYFGGTIETLLMRLADVILVLPGLPILIIFSAVMGPSIWNLVIIIALLGWAGSSRIIRSVVLSLKERPFIESAKVTGASNARIMFKHIAPNVLPLSFLFMTFAVTGGIISEAGLSFLGLGDPTVTSWGQMLFEVSRGGYALTSWWWVLPPGLFITLICLGFFLLGRAFDEVVNPRLRRR